MAHRNTVLKQLLDLVPRHVFEQLAKSHHRGQKFRRTSRWSQFVALLFGQLAGRTSLCDIAANLATQQQALYHLGVKSVKRSTLSRVNQTQSYAFYEGLFHELLKECHGLRKGQLFRCGREHVLLDASLIDLSLKLFPWAHYAKGKAALKLHTGLSSDHLPCFVQITDSHTADIEVARKLDLAPGSVVVVDRGYVDLGWFKSLMDQGVFFVTRAKRNLRYRIVESRPVDPDSGVLADEIVQWTGDAARRAQLRPLRLVTYRDPDQGHVYRFLTNQMDWSAMTVAECYKERWQVELFFKWIKQNLKIRSFVGNSRNAVLTQIWVALCAYLLLWKLNRLSRQAHTLRSLLRVLQLNLFDRRALNELIRGDPPEPRHPSPQAQIAFT